jgi:nuclear transport factor 2 (NTF2) superfamily protein
MNAEEIRAFAIRYTAAWNSNDPASVAAFFAEDGTLSVNGSPAVGRDAITAVARGFMVGFPDMVLSMDELIVGENLVTYHWTFVGTNSGPEGTGNPVRFSGYEEWTFSGDGLVANSNGHFDADEYQDQLENGVGLSQP